MGRKEITQDIYEDLVEAFRDAPGLYGKVSEEVGVAFRTAQRAWLRGWSNKPWGRPIQEVIAGAQLVTRAEMLEAQKQAAKTIKRAVAAEVAASTPEAVKATVSEAKSIVKSAHHDAEQSRLEEARMVRATRQTGMAALAAIGKLLPGMVKIGEAASKQLVDLADGGKVSPKAVLNMMRSFASSYAAITAANQTVMEMERLYMGQPGAILGVQVDDINSMSLEDCLREHDAFERALERAKRGGHLKLIDGGKPN